MIAAEFTLSEQTGPSHLDEEGRSSLIVFTTNYSRLIVHSVPFLPR